MEQLNQLRRTIVADGRISSEDIKLLKSSMLDGEGINRKKANFLFDLKDMVSKEHITNEFKEVFVELFVNYLLEDEDSPGEIDEQEAKWLRAKMQTKGYLDSPFSQLNDLLDTEILGKLYQYSIYLFNKARIKDHRGVDKTEQNLIFMEPISVDDTANEKVHKYLEERGESNINRLSPRDDKKQSITIFRVSPPLKLSNFYDIE